MNADVTQLLKQMKTIFLHNKRIHIIKKIGIIFLGFLCVFSLLWFILSVRQLHESGKLVSDYNLRRNSNYPHNITNVNNIKTWMTFDYINFIFKLDPIYLKNTLMITDSRYPNIRIDHYTRGHNQNLLIFLQNIQLAITNYHSNKK
jgi:hypothetical protein